MAKPYDVTFKKLIERHPEDWARLLEVPTGGLMSPVDSDLSTISPAADKLFRVYHPLEYLLHLELVASYDRDDPDTWETHSSVARFKWKRLVRTIVILLRPQADGPAMKEGVVRRQFPGEEAYLTFRFRVVRVWEYSLEQVLDGGVGVWPLALLLNETQDRLPEVVEILKDGFARRTSRGEVEDMWAMCYILTGLRNSPAVARALFKGVRSMEESTTYQEIIAKGEALGIAKGKSLGIAEGKSLGIAEGRIETARHLLLSVAGKRFGPPDRVTRQIIDAIADYERLEYLTERALDVTSWEELLCGM